MNNRTPIITDPVIDDTAIQLPVNSPGGNIYRFLGTNGSNSSSTVDTNWSIINVFPFSGTEYFQIGATNGILSSNIQTSGTYVLTVKLIDAYNNNINQPTAASLSATRTLEVQADNIVIANTISQSYRTSGTGGDYVNDSGTIDIWQSLLPGEQVFSYNITINGYRTIGPTLYPPVASNITYNNDFTFSWYYTHSQTPLQPSDNRWNCATAILFSGTITTSTGRIINLKQQEIFGISPYITSYLFESAPYLYLDNGILNYRPGSMGIGVSFSIKNNSNDTSWFSALGKDGNVIIGNNIDPGQTITGGLATNDCIRDTSIKTEENVSPNFTIIYGTSCS